MNWLLDVTRAARKELQKIPARDFERIREVVETMKIDPFLGDRQKLEGEDNEYRRRIGNWRIFFHINTPMHVVTILHIRRRDSKTYRKR